MAEHLAYLQVKGTLAVGLLKGEVCIAGGLSHYVERGTLTLGNAVDVVDVMLVDEQTHALLALVGNDFLGRESVVAYGQLVHVDESSAVLHQLAQAVDMSGTAVVVDAHHGIHLLLAE